VNQQQKRGIKGSIFLVVAVIAVLIAVTHNSSNSNSANSNSAGGSNGASSGGKSNIYVVGSKSQCWEDPGYAVINTQVVLHNSGTKAGDANVQVNYRYNDGGSTIDGLMDSAHVLPGQTYYARFRHSYDALHHDVVQCQASLDTFNTEVDMNVLPPNS
jgi:hypothetical protein